MGVVNLTHGSFYMVGAYCAAYAIGTTGSFLAGVLAALLGAGLYGVSVEVLVIRKLYKRDHLYQVLATFGLLLFSNEAVSLIFGRRPPLVGIPSFLEGAVTLAPGFQYPVIRLSFIAIGALVAGGLWWRVNRTRIGMLIRAGADDREMVDALGVDIRKLYTLVFGLGALLCGLAGVMAAPLLAVEIGMGERILITTFVVIVIGGVGSPGASLPAADAVHGVLARHGRPAGGRPGVGQYLCADGDRADRQAGRLVPGARMMMAKTLSNRARWGLGGLAVLILLPAAALASGSPFLIGVVTRFLIYGLAAVSLDLVIGYGAMVSFGHAMFFGLGGYAVGIIAFHTAEAGPIFGWAGSNAALVVWPIALAVCALAGWIFGYLALRTRGVQFIMITLAFGQMPDGVLLRVPGAADRLDAVLHPRHQLAFRHGAASAAPKRTARGEPGRGAHALPAERLCAVRRGHGPGWRAVGQLRGAGDA
ncbi:hypothetical protein G6F22_012185 [Rhizopus arrhizus]|nr:hypothetical protein G6F22_012185 [Rhizopus arrhizus]